jgi:hypothetical protein
VLAVRQEAQEVPAKPAGALAPAAAAEAAAEEVVVVLGLKVILYH